MRSKIISSMAVAAVAAIAILVPAAPAQAAWGSSYPVSIQLSIGGQNLGNVTGSIQWETGSTAFRYDLTICRQSSYMIPFVVIDRNYYPGTYVTTVNPYASPCADAQGEVWTGHINNLYFEIFGSTFDGPAHVVYSEDHTYLNPY